MLVRFKRPGRRAWVRVGAAATYAEVYANGELMGSHLGAWTPFEFEISHVLKEDNVVEVRCSHRQHVTNGFLPAIGCGWTGARDVAIVSEPLIQRPSTPQRSAVRGTDLLVDGVRFRVRGILHWGYYPEIGKPWPSEAQMREEIQYLKSLGFNLIKFCLWIPPERYYQLCEELEVFVWQEYPIWNTPLADRSVKPEFEEFFRLDGPYSSVILRSLTCENDAVDPGLGSELVTLAKTMIPGCLIIDNSGWLCSERIGDFHDEHIYLNNMQWRYYPERVRHKLSKPLILGESMCVDSRPEGPHTTAVAVRRYQIETLAREIPSAGYVITTMRDTEFVTGGLSTHGGNPKYEPDAWVWHRDELAPPRQVVPANGPIIGPRKGEWKCPEHHWWSPVVRILDPLLPSELIQRESVFDLLSGRVLANCEGTRVLVELLDVHEAKNTYHPLVVEFTTQGNYRVVSAFRHDTAFGKELWALLQNRECEAPEIGELQGDAIVLEDWELSLNGETWEPVKCDTPLVNAGRNMFEGHGLFRTTLDYPGGRRTLRCDSVADFYEIFVDEMKFGEAGNRTGTWDGTRLRGREFEFSLPPGRYEIMVRVRDWTGMGSMVGPVYLASDFTQRIF